MRSKADSRMPILVGILWRPLASLARTGRRARPVPPGIVHFRHSISLAEPAELGVTGSLWAGRRACVCVDWLGGAARGRQIEQHEKHGERCTAAGRLEKPCRNNALGAAGGGKKSSGSTDLSNLLN
jgi:hypothetical protein